jgi:aspartyl aminopeptidase
VITRGHSCLIAVAVGRPPIPETGIRLVGAHTDSPCLRIKPNPEISFEGVVRLGVEVYGGALLSTWLDRGLNLAGRVSFRIPGPDGRDRIDSRTLSFDRAVAVIPSLAIHFDREAGTRKTLNPQVHLPALFRSGGPSTPCGFHDILAARLRQEHPDLSPGEILGFDLSLTDAEPPCLAGLNGEFILAPRLDNLLSCHAGLSAILRAPDRHTSLLLLADHEEVGSETRAGARGSFLDDVLQRLIPDSRDRLRALARSFLISCDNAHAVHPGYPEVHDANHLPGLNRGPVLKINASQRYASDSESAAVFRLVCGLAGVPVQVFVVRSDQPCGSTIGPSVSAGAGIRTVDAGCPTLGMHAIRETTGSRDPFLFFQALGQFLAMPDIPLLSLT